MTYPLQSCMGGKCAEREQCPNYHAATPLQTPVERLCEHGHEGAMREAVVTGDRWSDVMAQLWGIAA